MVTAVIIDDDEGTVAVFADLLEVIGVNVVGKSTDPISGAKIAIEKTPDIVFTDLMMPNNDGFYVIDEIQNAGINTEIVPVTADTTEESTRKLEERKIRCILYKPFAKESLIHIIEEKLEIKIS